MKGKVNDPKYKKVEKKKKVETPKDTPLRRIRRKNLSTSPLHSPQPLEAKEEVESSFEVESLENCMEEVDMPQINVQHPLLALAPAPMPTIERWRYPGMKARYNDGLSKLQNGKIK